MTTLAEPTNLEILLNSLIGFKKEVFTFLGQANNPALSLSASIKWKEEHLKTINQNLALLGMSLSIMTQMNDGFYGVKVVDYKPFIRLTLEDYILEYHTGFFFNRFKLSNEGHDILQLEPKLKVFHPLIGEKYADIAQIIHHATAELSQHVYLSVVRNEDFFDPQKTSQEEITPKSTQNSTIILSNINKEDTYDNLNKGILK